MATPGEESGGSIRVSIEQMMMMNKQSSARSLMSDVSRQSADSLNASTGAGDAAAAPASGSAATPTHMGQLAYSHSREARRLLKKEANHRSGRTSSADKSGGGAGGGPGFFVSPAALEGRMLVGGEGQGEGRELLGSPESSSNSLHAAHANKVGGAAPAAALHPLEIAPSPAATSTQRRRRISWPTWAGTLRAFKVFGRMVISKYINLLLLAAPFAILAHALKWGPGPIFFLNFVTLIPLAAMLGDLTEEVADHMGDTVGGLLNASFGNAVEMVIGVQALVHNEVRVVQSSLLGSVLSNLLLVMGCCFLFGGIRHPEQRFNSTAAVANLALLFLASIALVVPTPIGGSYDLTLEDKLLISRAAAIFLLAMYIQLLFFQMVTHKHLFTDVERHPNNNEGSSASIGNGAAAPAPALTGAAVVAGGEAAAQETAEKEEEGEEEERGENELGLCASVVGLFGITAVVAFFSELLVASIDDVCRDYKISKVFVGVVLIPIVGNATEHMTAVTVACKNRMELAMGIAVGSATQISVFVIPFLVIAGWILDKPMTLNFTPLELVLYIMSVIITIPVLTAGNSNWIHGSLLITCYLFISFAVWHEHIVEPSGGESRRLAGAPGAWDGL